MLTKSASQWDLMIEKDPKTALNRLGKKYFSDFYNKFTNAT